jgi:trigger factor
VTDSSESVKEGDLVTISYVGTVNGELLESEDYYDLTVGEGSMTDGFEDGLIGMKKGETRTLNLTFPEDFYSDELSGQDVVYKVTLQSFKRDTVIYDAYVAANTEASTLEEYTQMIRTQMEENAEAEAKENLRSIAWDTILTNSEVMEYPQADIDNAIDEYKRHIMEYNNDSDLTLEEFVESQNMTMESFEEQCQQYAESKVKQNLIVQGIMDAEGLSLEDAQSLAIQDQLVEDFAVSSLAELIDAYGQSMIDEAIGLIRVEDFIVENANVEEYVSDGGLAGIDAGEGEDIFSDEDADVIENVVDEEEE